MNTFKPSPFDYTVTITRKNRYLVVSSPEFGLQIAANCVDLARAFAPGESTAEAIGRAVLGVLTGINQKLHELQRHGEPPPAPHRGRGLLGRGILPARQAAAVLGIDRSTLRKLAYSGAIRSERTPGGHLRFTLDDLADYVERNRERVRLPIRAEVVQPPAPTPLRPRPSPHPHDDPPSAA
jgi:excisionase family DNA binding protein